MQGGTQTPHRGAGVPVRAALRARRELRAQEVQRHGAGTPSVWGGHGDTQGWGHPLCTWHPQPEPFPLLALSSPPRTGLEPLSAAGALCRFVLPLHFPFLQASSLCFPFFCRRHCQVLFGATAFAVFLGHTQHPHLAPCRMQPPRAMPSTNSSRYCFPRKYEGKRRGKRALSRLPLAPVGRNVRHKRRFRGHGETPPPKFTHWLPTQSTIPEAPACRARWWHRALVHP